MSYDADQELAALRDRVAQVAAAYRRSAQRYAGASTLDTDVAQMLRNLLIENHSAFKSRPAASCAYTTSSADYCHAHDGYLSDPDGRCDAEPIRTQVEGSVDDSCHTATRPTHPPHDPAASAADEED